MGTMTANPVEAFVADDAVSVRRATEFTYLPDSAVPGETDLTLFSIRVAWRGPGSWAVLWLGYCWGPEGWGYEPGSPERDEEYLIAHRFTIQEAEAIALREVNNITINGRTWIEDRREREARRSASEK